MGNSRYSWVWPAAIALVLAGCAPVDETYEKQQLELIEDLSESLANDLHALSVGLRDREPGDIEKYFAETVRATPLPNRPGTLEPAVKWIGKHGWTAGDEPGGSLERSVFLGRLGILLDHFSEIEDIRFKVLGAEFDPERPDEGTAAIKWYVIARDNRGKREWLKAKISIDAYRQSDIEDAPWRIRRFDVESIESEVSEEDLFSEVALPAGVSAFFPPFGVGANTGFVSHGAAVADVNGDGLLDIAATGVDQNYLYINRGDGRFDDLSSDSLVGYAPPGSGALFLDYDNDGDKDLFLAAVGNQMLLQNRWVEDGEIVFWDVSEASGISIGAVGFSAAAADVNQDGFPDIYVASYNRYGTVMPNAWHRATNGTPNLLFLSQGDGRFKESAAAWGVNDSRWSYAATFIDLDVDGDQDLYLANDFGENAFYRNEGDRFVDVATDLGIVDPGFGMGVSFGDYDNDGDFDLHVTNMSSTAGNRIIKRLYPPEEREQGGLEKLAAGNSLYENTGDGSFQDVTAEAGGFPAGWAFGGGFFDLDNDGWEDLYTPNGFISGKSLKDT